MPFPTLPSPPTLFPTYLLPSNPFRRRNRKPSLESTTSSSSSSTTSPSPPTNAPTFLTTHTSHLRCARCLSDLALSSQIISKGFTGRHGRAYLVAPPSPSSPSKTPSRTTDPLPNLPNTYTHKPVPRQLVTGAHTVGDISCAQCGAVLGWKYIHAEEESQKYKVGKFILEMKRVCRSCRWEGEEEGEEGMGEEEEEEVEFDSDDEEECELLFLGQWTQERAREIRRGKEGRGFPNVVVE
ncbi:uncharacterized protein MYCFIDRAFT_211810 [Pseudocercospora fijiensis CIRAD86]|uniref:Yippee domain-containing protein n=1 Tax=Pseudocercospora fijiensis (strain CIRAD86) TaxID=383855 RepID=M3AV03_PSEFD|nr:uncharacterized protein MYCFIDRAFT_211810 [Pseudocercospora fijiensis CIRAD86]EME81312.1 hypothetical protein MYCFIDRAFT_211810 [Pseudocercospora fijiensis CIRAD86]